MLRRTGIYKTEKFVEKYPYELVNNEWKFKFPVGYTLLGRISTYNPDFFCPTTGYFIEVTTSEGNILEQGWRWCEAIDRGLMLKIFWWEGEDITEKIINEIMFNKKEYMQSYYRKYYKKNKKTIQRKRLERLKVRFGGLVKA